LIDWLIERLDNMIDWQTRTKTYSNTIVVKHETESVNNPALNPIEFRVYCTYKTYYQQTFAGQSVYWSARRCYYV